ncbi:glycosyltransferase [Candidatus Pelagibacter communis]|uniref:glycosyltransferase n=1 Tax=Pelagibacter ubique TaxID=198252 RepID=UPI00094D6FEC|nr:glycosyltransferase [Candidatus Pelagibacter ubique]
MKKHLNFYFPCIEDGGLEKNVFALVNSLARKNYKINFFTYEDTTKSKKLKKKFFFHKKINVIESAFFFNINRRYLKYLFCSLRLFFFCIFQKGTIISFQGNVLPIIIAKITSKKIIIRCNTAPSKYVTNIYKKIFFKFIYSLSDLILVTSEDFKKEIKKYFYLNSQVHRQSLDINNINRLSKYKFKFNFFENFNGLKIINVGRLTYQKDQMTLLKAFKKLLKFKKSRLLLIGSGEDENKLKKFIKDQEISKFVKFIAFTKNPFKYIAKSDVKVLSSKFEGNPNILLEVACLKKLIISSDCKVGPREILQAGKGGFLYKVGNDRKLCDLLKNIKLSSKEIKNKIKISNDYVFKNYQKDISMSFINLTKDI